MTLSVSRRAVVAGAPGIGIAALFGTLASRGAAQAAHPGDLYRVDEPAKIIEAARAIFAEDSIGTFITVDSAGMPRARPVGVWDLAKDDLVMWISTRRSSRKLGQVRANPSAALIFNFDDIPGNYANAYYANFMGKAYAHTDAATLSAKRPSEALQRSLWPNYPDDYAVIRFVPERLEVMGKGIMPSEESWQPQGVMIGG